MSSFDKVQIDLPNGDTFVGTKNLSVTTQQQPFYLLDGFKTLRTLGELTNLTDNDTSQAFLGGGARVRIWQVEFEQFEGSSDTWGGANASDDAIVKANTLDQSLATAGIDGTNTATLKWGEFSSGGDYSAQDVVPGEISISTNFGEDGEPSSLRVSMQWRDAEDMSNTIHKLKP